MSSEILVSPERLQQLITAGDCLVVDCRFDLSDVGKGRNENIVENCIQSLLKHDPLMVVFPEMTQDMQNREYGFLKNSVNGFLGYLKTTADNS